jgi:hypothetical protein
VSKGLQNLAVGKGWINVSNYGTYPATGTGPHGELVRLRAWRQSSPFRSGAVTYGP